MLIHSFGGTNIMIDEFNIETKTANYYELYIIIGAVSLIGYF